MQDATDSAKNFAVEMTKRNSLKIDCKKDKEDLNVKLALLNDRVKVADSNILAF